MKRVFRMFLALCMAIFALTGCISKTENMPDNSTILETEVAIDKDVAENEFDDVDEINIDYFFFGTWSLEKIVLIRLPEGYGELPGPPAAEPVIANFIGHELKITADSVRLGDRNLLYPEYSVRRNRLDWVFFNNVQTWKPAYYNNPAEFLKSMSEQGIAIGRKDDATGDVYIKNIWVQYPQYEQHWFQGWLLDPELLAS